ncbi:MAG: SDR family NAD(P)-dependent oxidoreductase [Bacteroidales bacterium]|nr:SDR family NAD(P)-dependent oxidoreductase [Bacteroidales bacterium]
MNYAIVTGGSSGIGLAYAEELAARNYNILIVSNREDLNLTAQQHLQSLYPNLEIKTLMMDLAVQEAAQQLFDYCKEQQLDVEVLVNNAGMFYFGAAVEKPVTLSEKMLNLHVHTPMALSILFGKAMKDRGHGYILNASSITAFMKFPTIAVYESTKTALMSFSYALSMELKHHGVNVCCVCPGAVDTDLYNLPVNTRKWLCRFGLMLKPNQVAKKGVRALFRGWKRRIPGAWSRVFVALSIIAPDFIVNIIKKKFV